MSKVVLKKKFANVHNVLIKIINISKCRRLLKWLS